MIENLLFALTLVSALGCGLIAGVFFAFSAFGSNGDTHYIITHVSHPKAGTQPITACSKTLK